MVLTWLPLHKELWSLDHGWNHRGAGRQREETKRMRNHGSSPPGRSEQSDVESEWGTERSKEIRTHNQERRTGGGEAKKYDEY